MPATALLTSEQYLALPDEFDQNGNRIKDELIGGQIVKMPPPSHRHDRIKNRIKFLIDRYLDNNREHVFDCLVETGARIGAHDIFVPDVSVVRRDRFSDDERILRGAPDLAIEVASPADRPDLLQAKVAAYLAAGAHAVWLVHPDQQAVTICTKETKRTLGPDQPIEDPLLPGFSIAVSELFNF